MPAPLIGLPALLQAIATIGVGGAVGYKAKKDLKPLVKELQSSPKNLDSTELRMLRALLLPNQALASELKDMTTSKSVGTTGEGAAIGPRVEDIEKVQKEIKELTKPPVNEPPKTEPIIEEFPRETEKKPDVPVSPEIDFETKETFPDQSEKIKIPLITYSKDSPKDLKDLVGRSVGQEKGEKAIDKLYDDSIFDGVLDSDQLNRMRQLEENYTGGLNDLGDAAIPVILENTMLDQHEEYMEDYKDALANAARETLGNEFKAYRLMEKEDALKMLTEGEFPNIKRLQEDEEGNEVYKDLIVDMMGQETPLSREAFSFSLSPKEALSFRFLSAGGRRDRKDEDFVLIEMKASPTDIIMRGHESEKDLILRVDGDSAGSSFVTPKLFNVYDIKFGEKNQVQLSENKEYKSFVDSSRAETKKPEAPAIIGTSAQEGGKIIKDITAGLSAQKNVVPSLLEQGQIAKPIKDFFESSNQVVNYKIGDTIGAYGGDVERSLDIEAFVKPDFNMNEFSEIIKDRAKEFNQDAVFVAESVDKNFKNANVGFSLDFGSDLMMQDALSIASSISRTANVDGFTFTTKNVNYGDTSLFLPQTEKDFALIEKTLKKFPLTDDVSKAGFMMPDGKMLNFNLRGRFSGRDTEHRNVGFLVKDGYNGLEFGPMYEWMLRTGGVRLTGNQNRLTAELAGKPTTTQIRKIVDEYNNNRDKYDSLLVGVTIPGTGSHSGIAPRQEFGQDSGLAMANDLRKATFRLPMENFYEINGEKASANDLYKRIQSIDIVGKTFTGIRQLNLPEFSNTKTEDALQKIINMENKLDEISESTGIKLLDKPKTKFYNTKVFKKGKDY